MTEARLIQSESRSTVLWMKIEFEEKREKKKAEAPGIVFREPFNIGFSHK